MTQDEIIQFAAALPGVAVETASQASGAPQVAWDDSFIFYDTPGQDTPPDRRFPFATIVIKDYPGFDEFSDLSRDGTFRLNINVGRARFEELLGYPPAQFADHQAAPDYRALDTVLPHPTYGQQAWISIVCPGPQTSDLARGLLTQARDRLADRPRKS
ncbi:MAG TPA: DUF6194 family protein [Streptosporangiaceae bacterium]|nr:DUF6194 family protein [Streptosporangiaceae bacterium]